MLTIILLIATLTTSSYAADATTNELNLNDSLDDARITNDTLDDFLKGMPIQDSDLLIRKYECPLCDMAFTRKDSRTRHLNRKTPCKPS